VSLSSSEAEYCALSEVAKDIHFIVMVLEVLGITVQSPIVVKVGNVGAIFMTENVSATSRLSILILDTILSVRLWKME
jgi:hypothetical protein